MKLVLFWAVLLALTPLVGCPDAAPPPAETPVTLSLDQPLDGETVSDPWVTVKGTLGGASKAPEVRLEVRWVPRSGKPESWPVTPTPSSEPPPNGGVPAKGAVVRSRVINPSELDPSAPLSFSSPREVTLQADGRVELYGRGSLDKDSFRDWLRSEVTGQSYDPRASQRLSLLLLRIYVADGVSVETVGELLKQCRREGVVRTELVLTPLTTVKGFETQVALAPGINRIRVVSDSFPGSPEVCVTRQ